MYVYMSETSSARQGAVGKEGGDFIQDHLSQLPNTTNNADQMLD